jgi:hypothetical protein
MEEWLLSFTDAAKTAGWTVETRLNPLLKVAPQITSRYPQLPADYELFLEWFAKAVNPQQNVWFNCDSELNGADPTLAFPWNAFELMSLEWADGDEEWSQQIRGFWDNHIPVVLGVEGDYEFIALHMQSGEAVHGVSPEFEQVSVVAASFREYLTRLIGAIQHSGIVSGLRLKDFN